MNHPERIEALFLQSPPCVEDETRPGWVYDPYGVRLDNMEDKNLTRAEVDKGIQDYENNVHMQAGLHGLPHWMLKMAVKKEFRKM